MWFCVQQNVWKSESSTSSSWTLHDLNLTAIQNFLWRFVKVWQILSLLNKCSPDLDDDKDRFHKF